MKELKFELEHGLALKGQGEEVKAQKSATLRLLTTGEMIAAASDSVKTVQTPDGNWLLLEDPIMASVHALRRQVVSIGEIPGPLEVDMLLKLDPVDFELLSEVADVFQRVSLEAALEVSLSRGKRVDPPSE